MWRTFGACVAIRQKWYLIYDTRSIYSAIHDCTDCNYLNTVRGVKVCNDELEAL